jgi:hypothetical protein
VLFLLFCPGHHTDSGFLKNKKIPVVTIGLVVPGLKIESIKVCKRNTLKSFWHLVFFNVNGTRIFY